MGVLRWRTSSHLSQFRSTLSRGLYRGIFVVGHDVASRKVVFRAGTGLELGEGGEADGGGLGEGVHGMVTQGDQLRRTFHGGTPQKMGWKLKINFRSITYQLPFEQKIGLTKYVIYIFNTLSNIFFIFALKVICI